VGFCSTGLQADWQRQSQDKMGTRVSVEIDDRGGIDAESCLTAVFSEFDRIEEMMSPYLPASELSRINRDAALQAVEVSPELYALLQQSLEFSRLSGGAFDISFASIGHRYDYRKREQPDAATINELLPSVDYRQIELKANRIRFTRAGMRIDLGGIAKGYAVDRAISILEHCGVKSGIVTAGGDSRMIGDKYGKPWIIGIQHPRREDELALRIPLENTALSTSGDYQRYFLTNDERIHHIINPQTGRSANKAWSVSVIGPDATTTDALSTTLFVLGAREGIKLIETLPQLDAIIIDAQGKVHYSSGLMPPGQEQ
jgi:thiamine biosynthesis lipoprotein